MKDLSAATTIQQQAELLDAQEQQARQQDTTVSRTGPPTVQGVAHALGNPKKLALIEESARKILEPRGLAWEDVEDVLPLSDFSSLLVVRLRPQSWNHRHAYAASGVRPERLRVAIEKALTQHNILRTMAIRDDDGEWSHVVMKPSSKWFGLSVKSGFHVENAGELRTLVLNDRELDCAAVPGPLFQVLIASIGVGDSAGFIFQGNHSIFDAISLSMFVKSVSEALSGAGESQQVLVSFKPYADSLFRARGARSTRQACERHASRLAGIGKCRVWPEQRAPEWFKGDDTGWTHHTGSPGEAGQRQKLDGKGACGVDGITEMIRIPLLPRV